MTAANFCIDRGMFEPDDIHPSSLQAGDVWEVIDNGTEHDKDFRSSLIGDRRKAIAVALRKAGILRPPFVHCNSRA